MKIRAWFIRFGFWAVALLWLPAGVVGQAALRFLSIEEVMSGSTARISAMMMSSPMLLILVPFGLPLALGCRYLWRLGFRRAAILTAVGVGCVTVVATVFAGLLGPVAIAVYAILLSLPVWGVGWWVSLRN